MNGDIEDERHFMLTCTAYNELRKELFGQIRVVSGGIWCLNSMQPESLFWLLLGGSKDKYEIKIFELVKNFIRRAHQRRQQL